MKKLFHACVLFISGALVAVHAGELKCKSGGETTMKDYIVAISLIQSGERLSPSQEKGVVDALQVAVADQCQQAALVLAEIRVNQAAALPKDTPRKVIEDFDDQIHMLLLEANKLGEGRLELGNFYLTSGSKFYSPRKGVRVLEDAARAGDKQAIAALANIYENGVAGVQVNREKANRWRGKLK